MLLHWASELPDISTHNPSHRVRRLVRLMRSLAVLACLVSHCKTNLRYAVTAEVASSSLVVPAILSKGRHFQTTPPTLFSGIAALLAVVGIYGLLTYTVKRRTAETGIRMALGSSRVRVARLTLLKRLGLIGVGSLFGLAAALFCTRLLATFLYGVPRIDPLTFFLVPTLLIVAALAACLIPSWKASRIDPMAALRHE